MSEYDDVCERIKKASSLKLGYPESLLSNIVQKNGQKIIDYKVLGIVPGSLADQLMVNVGEPDVESLTFDLEVKEQERQIISWLNCHFGTENLTGYVTSGGTEGNFAAMWWMRRLFKNKQKNPIVVFSETGCHYSIKKIVEQLQIKSMAIASHPDGKINTHELITKIQNYITQDPNAAFILVANMGSTIYGVIDDIPDIRKAMFAVTEHIKIHADGALLGIPLPVLKPFGSNIQNYFDEGGLDSISISGHKYLGTSLASGIVLTKKDILNEAFPKSPLIEYAGNIRDTTFSGCRSGLNILQIYHSLKTLKIGVDPNVLKTMVEENLKMAHLFFDKLRSCLKEHEILWPHKRFHVLFPQPSLEIMKKYRLMPHGDKAVACILPNVTKELMDMFVEDYQKDKIETYQISA